MKLENFKNWGDQKNQTSSCHGMVSITNLSYYYGAVHLPTTTFVQWLWMHQSEPQKFLTLTPSADAMASSKVLPK